MVYIKHKFLVAYIKQTTLDISTKTYTVTADTYAAAFDSVSENNIVPWLTSNTSWNIASLVYAGNEEE